MRLIRGLLSREEKEAYTLWLEVMDPNRKLVTRIIRFVNDPRPAMDMTAPHPSHVLAEHAIGLNISKKIWSSTFAMEANPFQ